MRVFTPRLALGLGLFTTLFALADAAQAGIIFNRGARRAARTAAYTAPAFDPCVCPPGAPPGASTSMYYPGGVALPMPAPAGTIPAPLPTPFPTQPAEGSTNATAISITDGAFQPAALTLQAGQTVRWTNNGLKPHTVTSDKGDWGSTELAPGQTFTATFTKAGEFSYYCKLHPDMKGTISVK